MATIDFAQHLADMQTALRSLWPDRKVVYFTEVSAGSFGDGPVLTAEEQNLLGRVTQAIGAARNSEDQIARTTAEIEEAAVFDFLNWLAPQHITTMRQTDTTAYVHAPEGALWERWKTERHL